MISTLFNSLLVVLLLHQSVIDNKNHRKTDVNHLPSSTKPQRGDFYWVTSYRAYFYSAPNYSYRYEKKYLVRGDYCEIIKYKNGFGYVNYYNAKVNKTTSGWLDLDDLVSDQD